MDPAYLAYETNPSGGELIVFCLVIGFMVIGVAGFIAFMVRLGRDPKIKGPALTGTAQVLTVARRGFAVGNYPARSALRIGLRVEIPGRQPYDVTIQQAFVPWAIPEVGMTVPVEVEAANPQNVRIDLSRPMTQNVRINLSGSPNVTVDPTNPQKIRINLGQPATVAQQAEAYRENPRSVPEVSAADLLASGQRVPAALKSFAVTGTTLRSLGRTSSWPELIDAPQYMLEVELHFPNLTPVTGRAVQPVPPAQVPNLAIGMELVCAVDHADPSHRFVVDWGDIPT
jgi:hypothetical protein